MRDPFCQRNKWCARPRDHNGPCADSLTVHDAWAQAHAQQQIATLNSARSDDAPQEVPDA